jgi:hypothetical protein
LAYSLTSLRSQSSPMGMPNWFRNQECKTVGLQVSDSFHHSVSPSETDPVPSSPQAFRQD